MNCNSFIIRFWVQILKYLNAHEYAWFAEFISVVETNDILVEKGDRILKCLVFGNPAQIARLMKMRRCFIEKK